MKNKRPVTLLFSLIFGARNRAKLGLALGALLTTSACLTLNVNLSLPEAAVQRATDDYVRDLYRAKEKEIAPSVKPAEPAKVSTLWNPSELLVPSAQAAETLKVDSARALEIRDKLAANVDEVIAQKRAGVLGESNDGSLVLKTPEKLKPLLQKKIQRLVADENALRTELYAEILKSNGLESARLQGIKESFGRSFQAQSPSGTWMQDSEGKWAQKP